MKFLLGSKKPTIIRDFIITFDFLEKSLPSHRHKSKYAHKIMIQVYYQKVVFKQNIITLNYPAAYWADRLILASHILRIFFVPSAYNFRLTYGKHGCWYLSLFRL